MSDCEHLPMFVMCVTQILSLVGKSDIIMWIISNSDNLPLFVLTVSDTCILFLVGNSGIVL